MNADTCQLQEKGGQFSIVSKGIIPLKVEISRLFLQHARYCSKYLSIVSIANEPANCVYRFSILLIFEELTELGSTKYFPSETW